MPDENYEPMDRRPIASREAKTSQSIAQWLADRNVSPNAISLAGLAAGVLAGVVFAATGALGDRPVWARACWIAGAALVQLRLLANMFDGMVAVARKRASAVGELYNEVPDRISDAFILIGLGYASGAGAAVLGWLAACVALFTAYVRAMGKVAGAHQEFCGPMAKPHRMFAVTIAALYCGLTPGAWQPLWGPGSAWGIAAVALWVIILGGLITAARRLARIAAALEGRDR
jgi:phosphatidylglycerophosphate synthase